MFNLYVWMVLDYDMWFIQNVLLDIIMKKSNMPNLYVRWF
jgi:hypothetical protein